MMSVVYDGRPDPCSFKDMLGRSITDLLDSDPDTIYLDADLMRCIGTFSYSRSHPDRGIEMGIAEANMVGVAAGLARSGFKPIIHSFGVFASRRCFDQVFLSAGYGGNDMTIIGSDPGVCATFNGGTHMPFEDITLYRAIPGSTVLEATDTVMLADIMRQITVRKGVKYIRLGRKSNALVYAQGSSFDIGKAVRLRGGNDVTLIASGIMVHQALQAALALEKEGVSAGVLDMFTIKPLDVQAVIDAAEKTGAIVTCENHNRIGGLTESVASALAMNKPTVMEYVAVEDRFGEVGPQDYLQETLGLTAACIAQKAKTAIMRKNAVSA